MGLFNLFKQKAKDNRANYDFDIEDREISLELRKKKAEIKKLQLERQAELDRLEYERKLYELKADLEDLRGTFEEDETDNGNNNPDLMLMGLLAKILNKNSPQSSVEQPPQTQQASNLIKLSDEQINGYLDSLPKHALKIGKSWSDEQIKTFIKANIPNIDEESINRTITLLRNR